MKRRSPQFSTIIPVYNVAPYLRECLDSVLAQTFTDWEAICVDDGSTDESGAILDEYAAKDGRFKVIHQTNAGVSVARNVALDIARGSWVTFLDADDRLDSWRLEFLNKVVRDNPDVDWIRETRYSAHSSGKSLNQDDAVVLKKVAHSRVFLFGWQSQKRNSLLWLNTYRASALKGVRFPPGVRYAEDDIFELRALGVLSACVEVGYGGYWYRDDREGAASRVIHVADSVKVHSLLLEVAREQKSLVEGLEDKRGFARVFTQTVRKDFGRVFRNWWRTGCDVRQQHVRVSRQIARCPYFEFRYIDNRCRAGYALYMRTGLLHLMTVEDVAWRLGGKCKRLCRDVIRPFLGRIVGGCHDGGALGCKKR